jgi:hypothetical protein
VHFQTGIEQFAQSVLIALFNSAEYLQHQLGIVVGTCGAILAGFSRLRSVRGGCALRVSGAQHRSKH